jgi:hypothetical protein
MKITNEQLKQIIKEELENVMAEMEEGEDKKEYTVALNYDTLKQAQEHLDVSEWEKKTAGKFDEYSYVAKIFAKDEEEIKKHLSSEGNEEYPSGKPDNMDYSILEPR